MSVLDDAFIVFIGFEGIFFKLFSQIIIVIF